MGTTAGKDDFFTKHLLGVGLECPTKLYYYAENYPQSKRAIPFIRHAVFNKRLLKALVRSIYPDGIFVEGSSILESASITKRHLRKDDVVLFNPIFESQNMMARLPVIEKQGKKMIAFHVQTKLFDSRSNRLTDSENNIHQKWRSYLIDFAYQLHIVKQNFPNAELQAILVLPEKSGRAYTNNLPAKLEPYTQISPKVSASNQELLAKLEVTELISKIWNSSSFADDYLPQPSFGDSLNYLRNLYLQHKKEEPEIGTKCKDCEFRVENNRIQNGVKSGFNSCWNSQMKSSNPSRSHVFDLIGPGINDLISRGVYDQRKIDLDEVMSPADILNADGRITHKMRQALQIYRAQNYEILKEIIRPQLKRELQRWEYPLHFLDFEAGNFTLPIRKNRSPYQLIVFQFSCHTLYSNGRWQHHQWIDDLNGEYPNYELIRQLSRIPEITNGTIVQYSDFERNALKTIRRELMQEQSKLRDAEKLIEWVEKVIHRNDSSDQKPPYIADLSRQVKHFYYNREMKNSLSIKNVLTSVMSHSDFLKEKYSKPYSSDNFESINWWQPDGKEGARNPYTILAETGDSPIRRGTEAMVVYGKLITQEVNSVERQAYQRALLKYCELDTLAMMMIYQHWKQEIGASS